MISKASEWLQKDKLLLIKGWTRNGLTNEQIAKNMGINPDTLYKWKKKYDEFNEVLKKGKEVVDLEVENALLKRAMGYTIQIKEQKLDKDGCVHDLVKDLHVPPDTTAQIFWLKNRKPKEWRDKVNIENEVSENGVLSQLVEAINNVKKS